MLTTEDFIKKYEQYSDEALIAIKKDIDSYGEDARAAVDIVLEKRGGEEKLLENKAAEDIITKEEKRIEKETSIFARRKIDVDFIKTMLTSTIISKPEVDSIIDYQFKIIEAELANEKVTGKTIVASSAGIVISSIIGGVLFGIQMIYTNRIFVILLFGLWSICYGIIKLITKKTSVNTAVLISSIIAFVLSIFIGLLLFSIIGYRV